MGLWIEIIDDDDNHNPFLPPPPLKALFYINNSYVQTGT